MQKLELTFFSALPQNYIIKIGFLDSFLRMFGQNRFGKNELEISTRPIQVDTEALEGTI